MHNKSLDLHIRAVSVSLVERALRTKTWDNGNSAKQRTMASNFGKASWGQTLVDGLKVATVATSFELGGRCEATRATPYCSFQRSPFAFDALRPETFPARDAPGEQRGKPVPTKPRTTKNIGAFKPLNAAPRDRRGAPDYGEY